MAKFAPSLRPEPAPRALRELGFDVSRNKAWYALALPQRAETGVVPVRRLASSRIMSRYVTVARVGGRSGASSGCRRQPCAGQ